MGVSERDIAAEIAGWLETDGFEVFHEVEIPNVESGRADLVAKKDNQILVVETKVILSFDVLEQARRWKTYANAVWIGVAFAKLTDGRRLAFRVCEKFLMMGVLEVGDGPGVKVRAPAPELSRLDDSLLMALRPEHKTFARGGSPGGGHATPYNITIRNLALFVAEHPACTMQEAVDGIRHHYRSSEAACNYLMKDAKAESIAGIKVGWRQRLWPA